MSFGAWKALADPLLENASEQTTRAAPSSASSLDLDSTSKSVKFPTAPQFSAASLHSLANQPLTRPTASSPSPSTPQERSLGHPTVESSLLRHPDRGGGFFHHRRARDKVPSLIETGRHAGQSRVEYQGFTNRWVLQYHAWKRDFFTSGINLRLPSLLGIMAAGYILSFALWALVWMAVRRWDERCLGGFGRHYRGFISAFLFATETQKTIGYGERFPRDCAISAWLVAMEVIWGQLLDAVTLGLIFARISHPRKRARTIFISDCAVIARRDGVLKFMFRVADVRQSQVVSPAVNAFMYSWGPGRVTAEGEHIPVLVDQIPLAPQGALSLELPLTLEHTIDEASPLRGHNLESLNALQVEIVVTFEGVTESGCLFAGKRSYLPSEIMWGYVFSNIIHPAAKGSTRHHVDLARFHEVEPQSNMEELVPQWVLARNLLAGGEREVPFPSLAENTLALSSVACVGPGGPQGAAALMFRVGDVYPPNMMSVEARLFLYRWHEASAASGAAPAFEVQELPLTCCGQPCTRLLLRVPLVLAHPLGDDSPLAGWREGAGAVLQDHCCELVLVVEAVRYSAAREVKRQRTYNVHTDVKLGQSFRPMVSRPHSKQQPRVEWPLFHETEHTPLPRLNSLRGSHSYPTGGAQQGRPGLRDARHSSGDLGLRAPEAPAAGGYPPLQGGGRPLSPERDQLAAQDHSRQLASIFEGRRRNKR